MNLIAILISRFQCRTSINCCLFSFDTIQLSSSQCTHKILELDVHCANKFPMNRVQTVQSYFVMFCSAPDAFLLKRVHHSSGP